MSEIKKLYRSREDRMLSGVCGGLGAYFGVDPTLIRVAFLILSLAAGGGPLLYLVMWVIVPEEPYEKEKREG